MKSWGHMKFENESEIACWNTFQWKHSVTLGNWMTIIILLIDWSTSINSFHQLSYFEFAVCTINRWKAEDIWNLKMRVKLHVEIPFNENIVLLLEIGWPLLSC